MPTTSFRQRCAVTGAAVVTAATLAACGSGPSRSSSTPTPAGSDTTSSLAAYRLPHEIEVAEAGVTLTPVDVTDLDVVPLEVAQRSVSTSFGSGSQYVPYLASLTDTNSPTTSDTGPLPAEHGRLVWAFVDTTSTVGQGGPDGGVPIPGQTPEPPPTYAPGDCISFVAVDAHTGNYLSGAGSCSAPTSQFHEVEKRRRTPSHAHDSAA